jgi:hypothetical protein
MVRAGFCPIPVRHGQRDMNRPARWAVLLGIYILLAVAGVVLGHWLAGHSEMEFANDDSGRADFIMMAVSAVYIMASALPFVPGAEIGFAMIMVMGSKVVFLVYICMVLAMVLAYAAGRFIPIEVLARGLGYLGLSTARKFILEIAGMTSAERLRFIVDRSPNRLVPFLLKYRYLALALALNIPGNSLVGGGGGLSMVAGISGLFSLWAFIVTALVAIAPIPLAIYLLDWQPLLGRLLF